MKKPEIQEALIRALRAGMDSALEVLGYTRPPKGLVYSRTKDETKCLFTVEFASNPSYEPSAVAHLTPALRVESRRIAKLALELVGDPVLLANAPEVVQNRRLTMVTSPQMPEWYIANVAQFGSAIETIGDVFVQHGLPFLDDYATPVGMIRQYEAGDTRALRQQHYYVFVIVAYLLEGRAVDAQQSTVVSTRGTPAAYAPAAPGFRPGHC
jgi:hypothetical protein